MLILFFDTYIVSDENLKQGYLKNLYVLDTLSAVRDSLHTYRWQSKIDVVKYTLASYSKIRWDKIIIRFECEDKDQTDGFKLFCQELFPNAEVYNERSATAIQYYKALSAIGSFDDAWVFFSPNNDHPYLAAPEDLARFISIADNVSEKFPDHDISLSYSHFTESMTDNRISDPQWGCYGNVFKKVIYENDDVLVTTSNKLCIDSIKIFKLAYLKKIFHATEKHGRIIRLEDTEFYLSREHNMINIAPKVELCRHYDSYAHIMDCVPPLFIPDGFFEKNIKIRFGYDIAINGWVSINPLKPSIDAGTDMMILLEDIPFFWRDRISETDINPSFSQSLNKNDIPYYNNILNPWRIHSKLRNYLRSLYIYLILQPLDSVSGMVGTVIKKLGLYSTVRSIMNRILK